MNIDTNSKANPSFEKLEFQANKNLKTEDTSSLSCSSDMAPNVMKLYENLDQEVIDDFHKMATLPLELKNIIT